MRESLLVIIIATLLAIQGHGQSLIGKWQVVKESHCLGDESEPASETEEELTEKMASLSGVTPKILQFNADNSGEQNWKSVEKKKSGVKEKFLYKVDDDTLYLLDKKSRLITDTYLIQLRSQHSLILINKSRTCERMELVRTN